MSSGISIQEYDTSMFRKKQGADFTPHFCFATRAQGTFGDMYTRTEETASTTTNISTGASAANVIDSYEFGGAQMGSSAADDTEVVFFDEVGGAVNVVEYTGDGNATQAITGVGFQPAAVLAMEPGASSFIKTLDHAGANARGLDENTGANNSDAIISLDSDGFTVGSAANLNALGTNYVALCLAETGDDNGIFLVSGMGISVVSYTGDGASSRSITGAGFLPDLAILIRTDATAQVIGYKSRKMLDGSALDVNTGVEVTTNTVDTLDADGLTFLGTGAWNVNLATYSVIFLKAGRRET
jgi:hypothetical protein